MQVLRKGASGRSVRWLQRRLHEHGFPPGVFDGIFGPATYAAVLGVQRSNGLLADGIVGPLTWAALDADGGMPRSVIGQLRTDLVAELFPYTRLDAINSHLPNVTAALQERELTTKPMVLMALATIRAESEGFEPVSELPSRFNSSPGGHQFDLYDHRTDLGNRGAPDGERFRGRGFVQLTGRANYADVGASLGMGNDLLDEPELANDPLIASRILAAFLATRCNRIKEALKDRDLIHARRLVNGGSHGIDRFRDCYDRGDRLLDDDVWCSPTPSVIIAPA